MVVITIRRADLMAIRDYFRSCVSGAKRRPSAAPAKQEAVDTLRELGFSVVGRTGARPRPEVRKQVRR